METEISLFKMKHSNGTIVAFSQFIPDEYEPSYVLHEPMTIIIPNYSLEEDSGNMILLPWIYRGSVQKASYLIKSSEIITVSEVSLELKELYVNRIRNLKLVDQKNFNTLAHQNTERILKVYEELDGQEILEVSNWVKDQLESLRKGNFIKES